MVALARVGRVPVVVKVLVKVAVLARAMALRRNLYKQILLFKNRKRYEEIV